jgi:hypothetical protein
MGNYIGRRENLSSIASDHHGPSLNGTPMTRTERIHAALLLFLSAMIRRIRVIGVPLTYTPV